MRSVAMVYYFLFLSFLFSALYSTEHSSLGGKAKSLSALQQIPSINVPKWICIETEYFKQFIETNEISEHILSLNDLTDPTEIHLKAAEIQSRILNGVLSDELQNYLDKHLNSLMQDCDSFAVRSSCVFEDLSIGSFAGLYDSFLNQKSKTDITNSIKQCWASVFNDRAIFERNRHQLTHDKALIAVIIQEMVDAKAAGTAFTLEVSTGYEGIEIAANYGLGESVVDGSTSTDKWLIHPKTYHIIKSTLGSKKSKSIPTVALSGLDSKETTALERNSYALNPSTVQRIAAQVKQIAAYYKTPHIDTEFAVDQQDRIYFLQARPLVSIQENDIFVVDPTIAKDAPVLAKGNYSVSGTINGKLKVIPSFEALERGEITIDPEDIVVTYVSTNKWSQYMTNFKGMITQEGGPTSHPILLCRERKVPCVIGIDPDVFKHLLSFNKHEVTLDGLNQVIYLGKIPLKKCSYQDLSSRFHPPEEEVLPSREQQIENFKNYNVLISEFQDGKELLWQKKPAYPVDPLMQEINLLGYQKRAELLELKDFSSEAKVLNGYVVEKFMTDQEKLHFFSHMDLEKCKKFLNDHDETIKKYEKITENFSLTIKNWEEYIDTMSTLRAYIWLGHTFRLHANRMVAKESQNLQIPRHYIDAYAEQIQSQMKEEDTLLFHDIRHLAKLFSNLPSISFEEFKKHYPNEYRNLEHLGKQYRFQDNLSFTTELNLEALFNRIIKESKQLVLDSPSNTSRSNHDFFPQDAQLKNWIEIASKSRILQSNTHHKIIRGQWQVREKLLELGMGKAIFNCSIEEISSMINAYSGKIDSENPQ